jgi:hypothetical protein
MLRNLYYYMGVVSFQGVTYDGKHTALVTPALWLSVQDVLAAHARRREGSTPTTCAAQRLWQARRDGEPRRFKP